jgi:hypothetical protein
MLTKSSPSETATQPGRRRKNGTREANDRNTLTRGVEWEEAEDISGEPTARFDLADFPRHGNVPGGGV